MQTPTDEWLTERLGSDPQGAFRVIYDRYAGLLLRYLYRFTKGDQASAEDILHDVFSELLRGAYRPVDGSGLKPWLFTVARNKSLSRARNLKREAPELNLDVASDVDLETDFAQAQRQKHFVVAQAKLPADLAETWSLRREGFSYEQIAAKLQIPLGTVKSRFARLVVHLREEMQK